MDAKLSNFPEYLKEEVKKYGGRMAPVKAGVFERLLTRKMAVTKLHPNPEDEFSQSEIGPNYSIIAKYVARFEQADLIKKREELAGQQN